MGLLFSTLSGQVRTNWFQGAGMFLGLLIGRMQAGDRASKRSPQLSPNQFEIQTNPLARMKNLKTRQTHGFSLVELLVVIAVIGVIAAIAIPAMSNIFGNSQAAKTKRNAQNIASAYGLARAAGASFTGGTGGGVADEAAAAAQLNTGINGSGTFSSSRFQVVLDAAEQTKALEYTVYDPTNDILSYTGTSSN